jgi:miniconductance mechanosensitive channel
MNLSFIQFNANAGKMFSQFEEVLFRIGIDEKLAVYIKVAVLGCIAVFVSIVTHFIVKRYLVKSIERLIKKTESRYDDFFVKRNLLKRAAYLIPALVIYLLLDVVFYEIEALNLFFHDVVSVYFIIVILLVVDSFFKALQDIYSTFPFSKNRPIKGYLQGIQLVFVLLAILVVISILFNIRLTVVFTGLGAVAAVLILVFKDTILGFVASIQLSVNNMVKPGDWISMPSHGADGTVVEITLNTVKVQNWDKTITTIPTYALVSDSFMNWKGMEESGGRRIKRSVNIDMKSIKFCDHEMIERFKKIRVLRAYISNKLNEIEEYNKQYNVDGLDTINARRMTNLGVFRKYLEEYLKDHPKIHNDMTFLVRHLQSTEKGIPIEIYVFSKDQEWSNYEVVQADIFDHILAVIPEFGLKVFQFPTENFSPSLASH